MEHFILHIDVNNAFLSWTAIDRLQNGEKLDIRTIPAIIGGDEEQRRGIVLAKSNIAKQFGVKTGEPIYFARKKCPNLQMFKGSFTVYRKYSNMMYEILLDYTDKIERFSIDECFLDMTQYIKNTYSLELKAKEISQRIHEELGFTVNVGISSNKILAKMASDFEKPNKIHTLYKHELEKKLWSLSVSELFMVGKKSLPKLEQMHIKTIGDLAKYDKERIFRTFGKFGRMIWEYANGMDESKVNYLSEKPKGIGNSTTLAHDYNNLNQIQEILLALTEHVAYRLRKEELLACVVSVQIKTNEFKLFSHQKKMDLATDSTKIIFEEAKKLLKNLLKGRSIRLIGIRVDQLIEKHEKQISLFETENITKQGELDKAVDAIKEKYGYDSITRAGNLTLDKINMKD